MNDTGWMRLHSPATLAVIRRSAGLGQRTLAAQIGCSRGTIGDLETGRRAVVTTAAAMEIARALRNVDIRLLFEPAPKPRTASRIYTKRVA